MRGRTADRTESPFASWLKKALGWLFTTMGCLTGASLLAYVGAMPGPGYPKASIQLDYSATLSQWSLTLSVLSIGLLSVVAALIALRKPRAAAYLLLVPAAIFITVWALNLPKKAGQMLEGPDYALSDLSFWASLLLLVVPGVFWYVAAGLRWPPTLSSPVAWWKKTVVGALISISVFAGVIILDLRMFGYPSCHGDVPLFDQQVTPEQGVFVSGIIWSGYIYPSPEWRTPGVPSKQWALAWVEKEHWGLPWWNKKLVLLIAGNNSGATVFPAKETFFVDGYRQPGVLTRYLPIFGTNCTRTRRLDTAEFELRIMREGAPRNGVRIIGRTYRMNSEGVREPAPGAELMIRGAVGRTTIVSDQNGVFDTGEISPGSYEVYGGRSYVPQCHWRHLKVGEVRDCDVNAESR